VADNANIASLARTFPALLHLDLFRRRQRMPFVQQLEASDCGAACLAMVLGLNGRHTSLAETRRAVGSGRGGVSAEAILDGAAKFDLLGRGVRLEPEDLRYLPRGSILHWGFNHFVIFDDVSRRTVRIFDPAAGPRTITQQTFRQQFTGVALVFERDTGFAAIEQSRSSWFDYWRHISMHGGLVVRAVVLSLMIQLFAMALPIATGLLVDDVVPRGDFSLLEVLGFGLGFVIVFHFVASLVRSNLLIYLRTLLDTQLGLGFMDRLVRLPYAFFLERPTGDLLVRYQSNQRVREILTSAAMSALFDGVLVGLYLVVILLLSPMIAGITTLLALLQVSVFILLRRRVHDLATRDLEVRARSHSHLVEMIAGMETLKALGAEHRSLERWSHRFVDELNVAVAQGRLSAWTNSIRATLGFASPLIVLLAGAMLVMQGQLTLGMMLALSALAVGFLGPLGNLVWTAFELQQVRSHLERISDVTMAEPERRPTENATSHQISGEIELDHVSFRYYRDHPPVLRELSHHIEPGQKIAIVGKSGAGKSTLARLFVGLYEPSSGRMLFDGVDLASLDLRDVRQQIGVVTQDAHLFGTSVRNNVSLSDPSISFEQVVEACKLAAIHDEISAMPMGYDLLLTDGGASLSGGQRQRITLARALVRQPKILLLDEATSDLDTVTETKIIANLRATRCTQVLIAHRLSTIIDADCILVLEGGRIVQRGSHQDLVARAGPYAELVAAQSVAGS
jgi:ATP-binding cassette subfamily B protein